MGGSPPQRQGAPSLRLRPRRMSQLAPGAEARLQLALVRAGAVTPPALPAPSPPRVGLRGRGEAPGLTMGEGAGKGAGMGRGWSPDSGVVGRAPARGLRNPKGAGAARGCVPGPRRPGCRGRGGEWRHRSPRGREEKCKHGNRGKGERGESLQPHPGGKSGLGPLPGRGRPASCFGSGSRTARGRDWAAFP